MVAICILMLVGAFAKSAQLPLHTWLPDAMEGPTPVSALIHAATMVTAGVYLIARMFPFFELAPTAADIAAFVGLATLIVAATIALVVTDLKRIIAYSTMSQIGYMVVGVSIGAYTAGLFHLMTHAFFKALLFMAAGSVIAAMANNQNIDRMSGFRRALPFTSLLLIVGALALAGFPGTSGFFSKDEILVFAAERGGMYWIFAIGGYAAAFLTAFYAFRIGFRVVYGEPCAEARELEQGHLAHGEPVNPATGEPEDTDVGFPGPEHHIAERAWPMAVAMSVLGVLAIVGGWIQIPGVDAVLEHFFEGTFEESALFHIVPSTGAAWLGLLVGGVLSIAGIGLAYLCYVARPQTTARLQQRFCAHARLPVPQVVLRRAPGRARLPADDRGRAVRQLGLRARRRPGDRRGRRRDRARRRRARARRAVGLRARLRAAAGRRLRGARRLLPGGGELSERRPAMLNVLLWAPLAAGVLVLLLPRGRRALGRRARGAGRARARDRPGRRLRLRRARASSTSSTSPGSPTSASATSSESTGSASSWSC